jgi:hypothetical protein
MSDYIRKSDGKVVEAYQYNGPADYLNILNLVNEIEDAEQWADDVLVSFPEVSGGDFIIEVFGHGGTFQRLTVSKGDYVIFSVIQYSNRYVPLVVSEKDFKANFGTMPNAIDEFLSEQVFSTVWDSDSKGSPLTSSLFKKNISGNHPSTQKKQNPDITFLPAYFLTEELDPQELADWVGENCDVVAKYTYSRNSKPFISSVVIFNKDGEETAEGVLDDIVIQVNPGVFVIVPGW